MHFSITGRHIEISEAMESYAREKSERLQRYYDRIESIEVIINQETTVFRVELVVHTNHRHTFVGQVDAPEYNEAIDLVVDKLERQLVKHKEKVRNRKHPDRPGAKMGEQESAGPHS